MIKFLIGLIIGILIGISLLSIMLVCKEEDK